jgi:hypothetical protein
MASGAVLARICSIAFGGSPRTNPTDQEMGRAPLGSHRAEIWLRLGCGSCCDLPRSARARPAIYEADMMQVDLLIRGSRVRSPDGSPGFSATSATVSSRSLAQWWRIGGVRWRHGHARFAMASRLSRSRALRRLADPLIESIHDVALLTRAVMRVVSRRRSMS